VAPLPHNVAAPRGGKARETSASFTRTRASRFLSLLTRRRNAYERAIISVRAQAGDALGIALIYRGTHRGWRVVPAHNACRIARM